MDLCIKTLEKKEKKMDKKMGFNPCFNGSMYKNIDCAFESSRDSEFQSLF